ncbi:MAG: DUF975 family protein [Lachnospiraceae bacterium]|nr:DUF975 family protein [Lachnospiraceae bacterium]
MTLHELSANLKNTARLKLEGRYGVAVLLISLFYLITFASQEIVFLPVDFIAALLTLLNESYVPGPGYYIISFLLSTVLSVFLGILNTGLALFFLNIACGRTASVFDLLYGYRYMFKKSLSLSAIMVLINTILLLPFHICYYLYMADSTGSTDWFFYMMIAYITCYIINIPISLALSQVYFLLLDFPQYSVKQLLSLSIRLMKGQKGKRFYLEWSFLPLELLSMLTLGVGLLWVVPYRSLTMAIFFLDIMKSKAGVAK